MKPNCRRIAGFRRDDAIVQPYVSGRAASVAFLIGPGRRLALPAAAQHLSTDGRFRYQGGSLPLPPPFADRATRIAARAVDAVEGLQGYVGVDVVLGAAADDGDCVIEINPRLTTSYIGLRALARFNLAEAMLAVAAGQAPPAWDWERGAGRVHAGRPADSALFHAGAVGSATVRERSSPRPSRRASDLAG